jgi:hypothetical protein
MTFKQTSTYQCWLARALKSPLNGVQEAAGSNPAGPRSAKADKQKLCGYRNTDSGNIGNGHCPNIAQKKLDTIRAHPKKTTYVSMTRQTMFKWNFE